jgi:hypothetical protein
MRRDYLAGNLDTARLWKTKKEPALEGGRWHAATVKRVLARLACRPDPLARVQGS